MNKCNNQTMFAQLYKKHVRGTPKKAIVQFVQIFICHFTIAVVKGIDASCNKVYLNTRVIKHIYDKRTAEEFDFWVANLHIILKYPDKIYKNKDGKRGAYCFVKEINNYKCFCSLETTTKDDQPPICEVVTFFRTDENYLKSYELLWEWKGGTPSS